MNIASLKQDNDSTSNEGLHLSANEPDSDDDESILHNEAICCTAKNMLLSISAILELAHTSDKGDIHYSLDAALLYSAQIKFHTGEKEYACKYDIFCKCCGKKLYKNESYSLSMAQAMTILPDTIFCHKFWAVLGDKEIKRYLFNTHFEVNGIKKCTEAMHSHDYQNDCCIGNNQQILDALSPHKYEDCIKDIFDIMDAFFTVPSKIMKGHSSPDIIFLPLEQMMRDKLYNSLDEFSQQNLMRSWTMHLKAPSRNYFPSTTAEHSLTHWIGWKGCN